MFILTCMDFLCVKNKVISLLNFNKNTCIFKYLYTYIHVHLPCISESLTFQTGNESGLHANFESRTPKKMLHVFR